MNKGGTVVRLTLLAELLSVGLLLGSIYAVALLAHGLGIG